VLRRPLSFGVVAVVVALGVGVAGAAPIIVSTTQTEVTIGGLACGTQYRLRVNVTGDSKVTTLNPVTKPCPPHQPPPPPPPPPPSPPPADPQGGWYSSASTYNTPIPPGTPYHPNDTSLINQLELANTMGIALGGTPAAYHGSNSTPLVTFWDNHPTCHNASYQVPIPAGAKSPWGMNNSNVESVMLVTNRDNGKEWDFYKVTAPGEPRLVAGGGQSGTCDSGPNDWNAEIVSEFDPAAGEGGWQGLANEACCSGRVAKVYQGAGTIRPRDTKKPSGATYDHALGLTYAATLSVAPRWVWPAKGTGGVNCTDVTKCVPMGARFQLDPSFPCTTSTALEFEYQRQMCRTMQVYGLIIHDNPCLYPCMRVSISSMNPYAVRLNMANVDGGGNYQFPYDSAATYRRFPLVILQHMHVIDWEVWTGQ
jgi:hypothetical protein